MENVRCPTWSSRLNSPYREDAKLSGLSYPLSHKEDADLETRRFVVFFGTRDYMVCMWGRRDFPLLSKLERFEDVCTTNVTRAPQCVRALGCVSEHCLRSHGVPHMPQRLVSHC